MQSWYFFTYAAYSYRIVQYRYDLRAANDGENFFQNKTFELFISKKIDTMNIKNGIRKFGINIHGKTVV
jgi:hypothetical protein